MLCSAVCKTQPVRTGKEKDMFCMEDGGSVAEKQRCQIKSSKCWSGRQIRVQTTRPRVAMQQEESPKKSRRGSVDLLQEHQPQRAMGTAGRGALKGAETGWSK